jgi:hypothetical protein
MDNASSSSLATRPTYVSGLLGGGESWKYRYIENREPDAAAKEKDARCLPRRAGQLEADNNARTPIKYLQVVSRPNNERPWKYTILKCHRFWIHHGLLTLLQLAPVGPRARCAGDGPGRLGQKHGRPQLKCSMTAKEAVMVN